MYMANHFGIRLFLFSGNDINFKSKTIDALFIEYGISMRNTTLFPHLLDNSQAIGRESTREAFTKAGTILVQPFVKPSKMQTFQLLLENKRFNELLIPHFLLDGPELLEKYLREFNRQIVMKPEKGSGGIGVMKISKKNNKYHIISENELTVLSKNEWIACSNALFQKKRYIVQPYIQSRTKSGAPFDIRIHARRGKGGNFIVDYAPRIGNPAGIVSNMHSGGYTLPIDIFLKLEWGETAKEIQAGLSEIGDTFPEYYQSFFDQTTSFVGLDIGIERIAKNGFRFRLFEVNAYPAFCPGIIIKDAVTQFEYYRYLYEKYYPNDQVRQRDVLKPAQ
jgi:UDP-N-acetylmuramoyl-tripeptide--D-alanyl-D-alanine ligase